MIERRPIRASFPVCPDSYTTCSIPLLTRKTCPSGCRTCISRTFHGMSSGGKVTSSPAATHCLWTSSTSLTHTDIQTPLSAVSSPSGPNVEAFAPLPRPPWPPWQRKISHSPDPTAPKVGGVPQSQHFLQPHFSNHAKLAAMSDTFSIGVTCLAFMPPKDSTAIKAAPERQDHAGSRGENQSQKPQTEKRRMRHPAERTLETSSLGFRLGGAEVLQIHLRFNGLPEAYPNSRSDEPRTQKRHEKV